MRFLAIPLYVASIICGCSHTPPNLPSLTFGDGDQILKAVLDVTLDGQTTQFSELSWSGSNDGNDFAVDDSIIVKNASVWTIAAKLSAELNKLPDRRGWKYYYSESSTVGNIQNIKFSYREGHTRFYFHFILVQHENDVNVLILHRGFRS